MSCAQGASHRESRRGGKCRYPRCSTISRHGRHKYFLYPLITKLTVLILAELAYGNSLNFLEAGIEKNDILDAMDTATSNWFQLASHFPSLISIMSKIPAPILKRYYAPITLQVLIAELILRYIVVDPD